MQRQREEEWMDAPDVSPQLLRNSLQFIRKVNRFLGYNRTTLSFFSQLSTSWKTKETIRILDVATGSADLPEAIAGWAASKKLAVEIVGIDLHALTASIARERVQHLPTIQIIEGNALQLPFADGAFDYVTTQMFLHHLDDDAVVQVFREMQRVSCRGWLAADLSRSRRALGWITLFTLFSPKIIRHDARASVRQAFTTKEISSLAAAAGIAKFKVSKHFGHRWVLLATR